MLKVLPFYLKMNFNEPKNGLKREKIAIFAFKF